MYLPICRNKQQTPNSIPGPHSDVHTDGDRRYEIPSQQLDIVPYDQLDRIYLHLNTDNRYLSLGIPEAEYDKIDETEYSTVIETDEKH